MCELDIEREREEEEMECVCVSSLSDQEGSNIAQVCSRVPPAL